MARPLGVSDDFVEYPLSKTATVDDSFVRENPSLKTICINANQNTNNWSKDNTATYSTNCIITSLSNQLQETATIVKAYNLQGIEVPTDTKDELIILLYSNGKTEKVIQY